MLNVKNLQDWLEAKKKFRLSDTQIQMARELGMNPKKLGKLANHKQEPWKLPLPLFIEECYYKRFHREKPETIRTLKQPEPTKKPSVPKNKSIQITER